MRIVITGGRGQLAADIAAALAEDEVLALGRDKLDITNPERVAEVMQAFKPSVVINTAAFHDVDLCESHPESSLAVNTAAPRRLAEACARASALLVHISTDYVFGGDSQEPYTEDDCVNPLSVYGVSKAAGEMAIRCTTREHVIVRTTGLYGAAGLKTKRGNFVERMLSLAARGTPIAVVCDQVLTPSFTQDISGVIAQLIHLGARGTFHVTNGGHCSWYEFATSIFDLAEVNADLSAVPQVERPSPARRPAFSVLAHVGMREIGLPEPRHWHDALAAYLSETKSART